MLEVTPTVLPCLYPDSGLLRPRCPEQTLTVPCILREDAPPKLGDSATETEAVLLEECLALVEVLDSPVVYADLDKSVTTRQPNLG